MKTAYAEIETDEQVLRKQRKIVCDAYNACTSTVRALGLAINAILQKTRVAQSA